MRRVFVRDAFEEHAPIRIFGSDAHHIQHVLRKQAGDLFVVVDPTGCVARARLRRFGEQFVEADLVERLLWDTEAPIEVTLAQCLPKGDKMDWIVQKAVELGVQAVQPVISEHCVVKYDDKKKVLRKEKWQKIAEEAAKQCGRTMLPEILPIVSLRALLENLPSDVVCILCYEGKAPQRLKPLLKRSNAKRYLILVGPEGGFSKAEAVACEEHGAVAATLGPRILRAETAAVAAVAMVLYERGDLGQ